MKLIRYAFYQKVRTGSYYNIAAADTFEHMSVELFPVFSPEAFDSSEEFLPAAESVLHKVVDSCNGLALVNYAELVFEEIVEYFRQIKYDLFVVLYHIQREVNGALAAVQSVIKIKNVHMLLVFPFRRLLIYIAL